MQESERLKAFWNTRYEEFSLRESGIKTLTPRFSELLYRCKRDAWLRGLAAARVDRRRPLRLVDGGCGQGFFAGVAQECLAQVDYTGLDISEKAIEHLRGRYPSFAWQVCDLAAPGLRLEPPCDLAQSIEVLHLIIDDANQRQAIANLAASLRPGGTLLLTDVLPAQRYLPNDYIVFRPLSHYQQLFATLGLTIVTVFPMYYCVPDMGAGPARLRRFWRRVPPDWVYAFDRLALALRLPQWRQSHDSRMKMIVARKAS